jgi:SAM-dependent methyltransferase
VKDPLSFWEQPDTVDRFAAREPDEELLGLLDRWDEPSRVRVLDLGCAAGRNTVALAERGFDTWSLDSSRAMRERTRERLAKLLGKAEASRRVRDGVMNDLSLFADDSFALVVALGVYHNATRREEWDGALAETARVLAPEGFLLTAVFTPETDLTGEGLCPVPDEPHVYEGLPSGRVFFVEPQVLDQEMARFGLRSERPIRVVVKATEGERRVINRGLYRKKERNNR